jgi:FtsZ-interacting cell division protein ZipA
MPELRWALLFLGLLFLGVLAWWELRRPRQAHRELGEPALPPHAAPEASAAEPRRAPERREPALTLPNIPLLEDAEDAPPVGELSDDSLIGLRIDGNRDEAEPAALDVEAAAIVPSEAEPVPESAGEPEGESPGAAPAAGVDPIVEWPDESARRIVAIRIVAPMDRFPGHAVRQALAAEGFVLGKFAIFHRAGPDGRAVMSVAGLNRPGTFDRESIDLQRYGGLNLFAVLPGPFTPGKAFDELLGAARNLNDRLQGALQDELGEPLTPVRAASIREALLIQARPGAPVAPS